MALSQYLLAHNVLSWYLATFLVTGTLQIVHEKNMMNNLVLGKCTLHNFSGIKISMYILVFLFSISCWQENSAQWYIILHLTATHQKHVKWDSHGIKWTKGNSDCNSRQFLNISC